MPRLAAETRRTVPLYAGGFLGPFGGAMLTALIPSIAGDLDASDGLVSLSITAYMIPFATLQLFSGTVAERVGASKVVRVGYVAFGASALACAFAPDIWSFVAARAAMGAANAFLSPILLAALSETVAPAVLGRAVGTFAAVQVAGLTFAPLLGGAIGELTWRLAFGLVAVIAILLAVPRLEVRRKAHADRRHVSLRTLLDRWIALVAGSAMAGYLGFTAIGFVVSLVAAGEYDLGAGTTGLLIAAYGLGGVLFGRVGGMAVDRAGRPLTAFVGTLGCGAGVLGMTFASAAWSVGLLYFGVGCASAFVWAGLNTIAVESFPANRGGAVSAYSAFKFVGVAIAPLVYVPLFHADTRLPFAIAAGFSALCAILILPWFRRYRAAA